MGGNVPNVSRTAGAKLGQDPLWQSDLGTVSYVLGPAGLAPGRHVLTLLSVLITTVADFHGG